MPTVLEIIDRYGSAYTDDAFAALTESEKVVCLASWFEFEVVLGGLAGFYGNSAGNHASETILALETIGAYDAALSIRDSVVFFGSAEQAQDREYRQDKIEAIWLALRDCEKAFDRQTPQVGQLLEAYIRAHFADEAS